jgi:ankyrin repeat protein
LSVSDLSSFPHIATFRDINSRSLLDVALECKHVDIVKDLLKLGFMSSHDDQTAVLNSAAQSGDLRIFEILCDSIEVYNLPDASTAFASACNAGCVEIVRLLLAKCPHLDLNSAMIDAAKCGHADVVSELISAGADIHRHPAQYFLVNVLAHYWGAALHGPKINIHPVIEVLIAAKVVVSRNGTVFWRFAGACGSISLFQYVLSLGFHDEDMLLGALQGACASEHTHVIDFLLDFAEKMEYNVEFATLADTAFDHASKVALRHLLKRYDPTVSSGPAHDSGQGVSYFRNDPMLLAYAVACGNCPMVSRLLHAGADVNRVHRDTTMRGGVSGYTVLSQAYDPVIIKALLEAKAGVNPPKCLPVLKAACEKLQPAGVQLLLEAGARARGAANIVGPLEYAISAKCGEGQGDDKIAVINLLLNAGAETRGIRNGQTALHLGMHAGAAACPIALIQPLLRHDPGMLEYAGYLGMTPLMHAVGGKTALPPPIVEALLEAGADVDAKDDEGKSAIIYLFNVNDRSHRDTREVLRMLLAAGADATACDAEGMSVLMWACMCSTGAGKDDHAHSVFVSDVLEHIIGHRNGGNKS